MAYDAQGNWRDENESVATRVAGLTKTNSPTMQQARATAQRQASRRGLLNSSIAGTAGESAAISAALPMASQEASQASQRNMQQVGITSDMDRLQAQLAATQRNTDAELSSRERIATGDRQAQLDIEQTKQAGSDRERALGAAVNLSGSYNTAFASLLANDKIPASTRDAYLASLQRQHDSNLALIEQIQGVDLTWGSSAGTTSGPGGLGPGLAGQTSTLAPPTLGQISDQDRMADLIRRGLLG